MYLSIATDALLLNFPPATGSPATDSSGLAFEPAPADHEISAAIALAAAGVVAAAAAQGVAVPLQFHSIRA